MAASKHQNEEEKQNNKNYNHPNAVIATSPVRLGRQTRPACTAVNVVVIVLMGVFLRLFDSESAPTTFCCCHHPCPAWTSVCPRPLYNLRGYPRGLVSQYVVGWLDGWLTGDGMPSEWEQSLKGNSDNCNCNNNNNCSKNNCNNDNWIIVKWIITITTNKKNIWEKHTHTSSACFRHSLNGYRRSIYMKTTATTWDAIKRPMCNSVRTRRPKNIATV